MTTATATGPITATGAAGADGHAHAQAPVVVVVADDGTRTLISSVLAEAGYAVLPTADGIEALAAIKLLRTQPPGMIVVDATLPVMDAATFLRAYRQQPLPHAPAVILTDQSPETFSAPTGPVAAVLAKPVAFEELLAVVRRYAAPQHEPVAQPDGRG